jgi:hypothetical protein
MFGQDTNQQMPVGSPTAQNPSMLDNVAATDFQMPDSAMTQAQPDPAQTPVVVYNPQPQNSSAAVTTDNLPPSSPVNPPALDEPGGDQSAYMAALSDDTSQTGGVASSTASEPVDQNKLADMKQEALAHLEPLADHIDGPAEDKFRTTMMMIQANDNHTLLEKALAAAKEITDDKMRAQAMLDIINEINYFSQTSQN